MFIQVEQASLLTGRSSKSAVNAYFAISEAQQLAARLVAGRALVSVLTGPSLRASTTGERWDLPDKVAKSMLASRLTNQ